MTFDRNPRWVGGLRPRFSLSVASALVMPWDHAPGLPAASSLSKNAYVERYHRTYAQECLQVYHPSTLQEVREVTEAFLSHYNDERPHQGRTCGNILFAPT